ncbi:MAG: amidohydrolase family protein [Bacillota bacterium]
MGNRIIDIHTHMFPLDVIKNQEKYCRLDTYFGLLADPKCTLQRYATAEEALTLADEAGVEKIVMQGWYWRDHALCKYHNDYMYEIIKQYPDRFEAFASINPRAGWRAVWELERCYHMGFAGVGEMGPGGQGWALNDHNFLQLMEAASACSMLVNIHAGEPVGRIYPGKDPTPLRGFHELAKLHPDLKIILAHWGGGLPYFELWPEVKEAMDNVYYDTAASPLLYDMRVFKCTAELVGAEKILFGSDFPLIIYPRKQTEAGFKMFLDDINQHGDLNEQQKNLILADNARRLLEGAGIRAVSPSKTKQF